MALAMRVNGPTTSKMGRATKPGLMELVTAVNTSLARRMDLAPLNGVTILFSLETLSIIILKVWEHIFGETSVDTKVSG